MELWEIWPVLPILGTGMLGAQSWRAQDELIRLEHNGYHEEWIKDGEPYGRWWWPPEVINPKFRVRPTKNLWNGSFVGLIWLIETPDWIKADDQALMLLKQMRLFSLLAILSFPSFLVIGMLMNRCF